MSAFETCYYFLGSAHFAIWSNAFLVSFKETEFHRLPTSISNLEYFYSYNESVRFLLGTFLI